MSILTIAFQAVNRSIRMSDGLSSCGAVFFLICKEFSKRNRGELQRACCSPRPLTRDWFLEMVDALDSVRETVSKRDMMGGYSTEYTVRTGAVKGRWEW